MTRVIVAVLLIFIVSCTSKPAIGETTKILATRLDKPLESEDFSIVLNNPPGPKQIKNFLPKLIGFVQTKQAGKYFTCEEFISALDREKNYLILSMPKDSLTVGNKIGQSMTFKFEDNSCATERSKDLAMEFMGVNRSEFISMQVAGCREIVLNSPAGSDFHKAKMVLVKNQAFDEQIQEEALKSMCDCTLNKFYSENDIIRLMNRGKDAFLKETELILSSKDYASCYQGLAQKIRAAIASQ